MLKCLIKLGFTFAAVLFVGDVNLLSQYRIRGQEGFAQAVHTAPVEDLEEISIDAKLGAQVRVNDITLTDEQGRESKLNSYFDGERPVLVSLVYFDCPSLCGLVLNGITHAMRRVDYTTGQDFIHLTVSINPEEDAELAAMKKANYLKEYGRLNAGYGWKFLTGKEEEIKKLASDLGFGYRYMEDTGEYAHSAGVFILTPEGRISRVLYGVQYEPKDLRLALLEASGGKIGSVVDKILMFCYRYDPSTKGYAFYALNVVRVGGGITALIVLLYLFTFWRRQRKSQKLRKGDH